MKLIDEIVNLYTLYEFEAENIQKDFITFQYNKGYFKNIEIVLLTETADIIDEKKQYEELGFSVSVKKFTSIKEMHEQLFAGFFKLTDTKKRFKKNYQQFCEMQTKKRVINEAYEYIECKYTLNYEPSDKDLTTFVAEKINDDTANLIIIEAAAGYGKTCTSYQLFNRISEMYQQKIPLLAELSKNRKASIFRYVLLSEIDTNFSGLNYDLVEAEILNGRVVLIIDGFDELLSKAIEKQNDANVDQIKDAQTMLDTIAQFLIGESKAKIILTSRKSSIFTGELFDNWIERRQFSCEIDRIQLGTPNPIKWIGIEKADYLKEHMSELYYISNPILLDTIKNISIEQLSGMTNDDVINNYFNVLLNRERERQALIMTSQEQINTMQELAAQFVDLDISSEEPKYLGEIIEIILGAKLDEYISKYEEQLGASEEILPNKDEFISKLIHHAFLDRVSVNKNNIGFMNDFIFGLFIGDALINDILDTSKLTYKYLDIATTAFSVRDPNKRQDLYNKVNPSMICLEENQRLYIESKLLYHASKSYNETTFNSLNFNEKFTFDKEHLFLNCSFYSCVFNKCTVSLNAFKECQFINCSFYDIEFIDKSELDNQLIFISCNGHKTFSELASQYVYYTDEEKNYKKILLEQFWKIGKEKADPKCGINTVYKGISKNDIHNIDNALTELISKGLIKKLTFCYELNFSRIDEIKEILGR